MHERLENRARAFVHEHAFFRVLASPETDAARVRQFTWCFDKLVKNFPPVVTASIRAARDPDVKRVLLENLGDECGNGDSTRAHHNIYRNYLRSLGLPFDESTCAHAEWWKNQLGGLFDRAETDAEVLGLLAAAEYLAGPALSEIFSALSARGLSGDDEYFTTHLMADEVHCLELHGRLLALDHDRSAALKAFENALAVWNAYFLGMLERLEDSARVTSHARRDR